MWRVDLYFDIDLWIGKPGFVIDKKNQTRFISIDEDGAREKIWKSDMIQKTQSQIQWHFRVG